MVEPWPRWRSVRIFVILFGSALSAQSGSIRGIVLDKDFEAPLGAAEVTIVERNVSVETTNQGNYVLQKVPPGRYTLAFTKAGYVRQLKPDVLVRAGQMTNVDASLGGDFTDVAPFVVQDILQIGQGTEREALKIRFERPAIMDLISAELMSRAGASDVAEALRIVSGASVRDGKSAVIRGLPDRYVSTQMNGMRLPTADEDKRAVELDQFPSSVVDRVQVSKTFTPDQQGDASGGAVNIQLRSIPKDRFYFSFKTESGYNTQVSGRSNFLSYDGGGVHTWARDGGGRAIQTDNIGGNWAGAAGVSELRAPIDYKWSAALGGHHEFGDGLKVGMFVNFFHERDSAFYKNGVDDSLWVESPGAKLTPKAFQGTVQGGDFKTGLFDVTRGEQSVQYGGMATFGVATENHSLNLHYLYSRTAEDKATLAEDTRGKEYFFPGHNPDDPTSPGHGEPDAAPYVRLETLEYTERTTDSLQFSGRHTLPLSVGFLRPPKFDWTVARSSAGLDQPDKRQFGSLWQPARSVGPISLPPTHSGFKPSANFTLGNLQRIYKSINEDSEQYSTNLEFPFEQWSRREGYLKFGLFEDKVVRQFKQETFSNFGDNSTYSGAWRQRWSSQFPFENHPITESFFDVNYRGDLKISASYAMLDLPLSETLKVIGGFRLENTRLGIVNDPEKDATWYPPGSTTQTKLEPGDADVTFRQDDLLPSVSLVFEPTEDISIRAAFNKTVARQTFKELSPILQQEFLGGPIFIGNPNLQMSKLRNYDLRVDYRPYESALFSASYFRKKIDHPIEYVQRVATFDYTTAVNYPTGQLSGYEFEARQDLGPVLQSLKGIGLGANATFIRAKVTLDAEEAAGFNLPNIRAPMSTRDMTNAPDHLYNIYLTYDAPEFGTKIGLFYTIQGDTLISGAGQSTGNFVPSIYSKEYGTLDLTVSQQLGKYLKLRCKAENLTNPARETVYRSQYIGSDVTKTSHTLGIDYSLMLGSAFKF